MKFGIVLTPVYGRETPPDRHVREHQEAARLAQELGFSTVVTGQHFLGSELRFYQPVPYLTALAGVVPEMRLATGVVLLSLVNPIDLAEQIATMDVLSRGRAVLGVGLGYSDHEYGAFGLDRRHRVRRFEESVTLIRKLWSGEPVEHEGRFFQLSIPVPAVQPAQERIPIWIGGQAEAPVRRAGRLGESWYAAPFCSHEEIRAYKRAFDEERDLAGYDEAIEFPVRRDLVISASRGDAIEDALHRSRARYQTYRDWGLNKGAGGVDTANYGDLDREQIEQRWILGDASACADQLLALQEETGMTEFVYKPHWQGFPHLESMRQLELFGEKVMPLVRG
ncbi:LLM class flavin-dependent oxidoreductase [Microbacterium sp. MAHUQ-60]|uniref:LLM class flavin-dependent oxidoreductase n=1 Tax=unclassified Microbacterium TaxID=2609290 RepID=UPI00360DC2DD